MSEHDPLCGWKPGVLSFCECDLIRGVRADERKTIVAEYVPVLMKHLRILADLRANVEALEEHIVERGELYVRRNDVLALFGGSSWG